VAYTFGQNRAIFVLSGPNQGVNNQDGIRGQAVSPFK
jgi:hypothetical protein